MARPCLQDLLRHWSFCLEASSHSSKQSAKGLTDHLCSLHHRVLFVHKGSDAMDPFLWSCRGGSSMTAEGQHVKHTVPSSGTGMSLITTAADRRWCQPRFKTSEEDFFGLTHALPCENMHVLLHVYKPDRQMSKWSTTWIIFVSC